MAKLETVKIELGETYTIINKSDFDKKEHKLWSDKSTKQAGKEIKKGDK